MEPMLDDPQTALKAASPIARFAQVEPASFRQEIVKLRAAVDAVTETISDQVEKENLTPIQGLGWLACTSGQAFGYAEFHGQPSQSDVVLRAIGADSQSR